MGWTKHKPKIRYLWAGLVSLLHCWTRNYNNLFPIFNIKYILKKNLLDGNLEEGIKLSSSSSFITKW